jgi:hypothetical protein
MPYVRMPTFDRRALLLGAARSAKLLAARMLQAAPLLGLTALSRAAGQGGEPLASPPEIRSRDGVLEATLTAACGPVRLGDREFGGMLYNGSSVPPTLRARLGDTLQITFRNHLVDRPPADEADLLGPFCSGPGTPSNALSRHERVAAGQQRQCLRACASRREFPIRSSHPGRGSAGAGPLLVSPARARLCRSADSRRPVGRSGGRRIRGALSLAARHVGAFFAHQARADRWRRSGFDQRPDHSDDRHAPRRHAVLAHRPYRCFASSSSASKAWRSM